MNLFRNLQIVFDWMKKNTKKMENDESIFGKVSLKKKKMMFIIIQLKYLNNEFHHF